MQQRLTFHIAFISLLLLIFTLGISAQDPRTGKVKELITDLFKKHLFNGAIVIGEKGKIIFSEGYGYANFKDSIPFTVYTSADGGSNAKTFTAASILWLAEKGKLNLNDPIQHYFPNYPYSNTRIWNFITHSVGGLPDYDYYFEKAPDTAVITNALNLHLIASHKPALPYPPNSNFHYDNVGFDIAAMLIEQVSGLSYEQFLRQHILGKLKMNSTFIRPQRFETWDAKRTIGYQYENDSLGLFDIADREGFYGGGNLWFSATDLYHWGESFYYHSILSKKLIEQITSPVLISGKPSQLTLGAWYHGKSSDAFYYWGNVAGFYSWVYWDKKKQFSIAFMTNTNMPQWTRPLLTSALIDIMEGKTIPPIIKQEYDLVNRNKPDQLAGVYQLADKRNIQISADEGRFYMKVDNGMLYRMYQVDSQTFYVPGFEAWISFSSLRENKYEVLHWNATVLQTSGKRVRD